MKDNARRAPGRDAREELSETALLALAREGDEAAIGHLIRTYNQRLFRTVRAILPDDAAAEDAVQETYLKAFSNLASFRGEAAFGTWLTRIALNEAYQALRRVKPSEAYDASSDQVVQRDGRVIAFPASGAGVEEDLMRREMRTLLEQAVGELPEAFRIVFTLRAMEGLSVREVARVLNLNLLTVKTRDFRARRMLRNTLEQRLMGGFSSAFPFAGARCAAFTARVLDELAARRQAGTDGPG